MFNRVLVAGGAGYVGAVLVPKLLSRGISVTVFDTMWFGDGVLPHDPRLTLVKGDLRDVNSFSRAVAGHQAVIHLACVANDPSFELNPELSKAINFDCFEPVVAAANGAGVKRFIYASTSSVYGVSDAPEVTEEHPLVPLTDYNRYKGLTEPLLLKYQSAEFTTVVIRPATVCGYSPRMRLDLSVNILTNHAINRGKITVFGGSQKRPNIHIEDITDLYCLLLELPSEQIAGETFNAGFQNRTIADIAEIVRATVQQEMPTLGPITVESSPSDDLRSYHVSSEKIARQLGFRPKFTIEDAVRDLCRAFRDGKLPNSFEDSRFYNVKQMRALGLA